MSNADTIYYQTHRDEILEKRRLYRMANREKISDCQKKYREINRQRLNAWHRQPHVRQHKKIVRARWNAESRNRVLRHYSGGEVHCRHCGIRDPDVLTIDHMNGNGRRHREQVNTYQSSTAFYRWLIRNDFPVGFQVLCANCQLKKERSERRQRFRIDGGAAF